MDETTKIAIFKGPKVRKTIYQNEWYFSVVEALTDSVKPRIPPPKPNLLRVGEDREYAILTAEISQATFGMTPSQYKKFKSLKRGVHSATSEVSVSTTDKTPTIYGKITDSLSGADNNGQTKQDESGPKIASGPKEVNSV